MVRVVLGAMVLVVGSLLLGAIGAAEWPRMLLLLATVPVVLGGGLLMGLDQNPPPWRRRGTAR
jgi:hypothetical protein